MKKLIKQTYPYLINVFVVMVVMLLTFVLSDTSPFGENVLGKSDAIVQFKPLLYDFIMGIKTHSLESFSFNNGLGNPTIFNFLYYLSSPFNLIALLFDEPDTMYLSAIFLKTFIASITMTFYLKQKTKNNFVSLIGSLSYVFSNWYLAYYFYLPWLDVFMIFPLFQLGLEKLLNGKEIYTYIFSLALLFICNFYLTFPICIYTLIYFIIYKFFYNKDNKLHYFNKITLSTITCFLLVSFYLYALFDSYLKMGLSFSNTINQNYKVTLIGLISSLFYGNINMITAFDGYTFPNIMTNTFVLVNVLYYFFNDKIDKKEKILSVIVLFVILASLFVKQFDFVLNLFHNVRGFTFRYSFIILFLSVLSFVRNFKTINGDICKNKVYIILMLLLIILLISFKSLATNLFVFNFCSILVYFVLTLFYDNSKSYKYLIVSVIIIQSVLACLINIPSDITLEENIDTSYYNVNSKHRLNVAYPEDDNEYSNKNLYTNTDVIYLYTSMTYNDVVYLMSALGCYTADNTLASCSSKDLITSMYLNVKDDYYLEKIFSVNNDILDVIPNYSNVKMTQETLIESTTGIKDIFDKTILKAENKDNYNYFYTDEDYYLIDKVISDDNVINFTQSYHEFFIDDLNINEVNIYTVNEEKLSEVYNILKNNQIEYTMYTDSHIKGNINVDDNQLIFTSIPFDKGWKVLIDGKEAKTIKLMDALLGIECEVGNHTIELIYKPNYTVSIIISITTFIGIFIKMTFDIKKKNEV